MVWTQVLRASTITAAFALVSFLLFGTKVACTVIGCSFVVICLLLWYTNRVVRAGTAVERGISWSSTTFAVLLAAKAATGLKLSGEAGAGLPWYSKFEFGQSDPHFLWAGVCVFAIGHVIVLLMQFAKKQK